MTFDSLTQNLVKLTKIGGLCASVALVAACSDDPDEKWQTSTSSSSSSSSSSSASTSSSSTSSSSTSSSSTTSSGASSSSSSTSSSGGDASSSSSSGGGSSDDTIEVDLTSGWFVNPSENNPNTIVMNYVSGGVAYAPSRSGDQLLRPIAGPINLNGATVTLEFYADSSFIDTGMNLQPVVQKRFGTWEGHWNCYINNSQLNSGSYTCSLPLTGWDITDEEGVQIGVQPHSESLNPVGSVTLTKVTIHLVPQPEEAPEPLSIDMTSSWYTSDNIDVTYTDEGVSRDVDANEQQIMSRILGAADYRGASITFNYTVSQAYADSGSHLQPIIQKLPSYDPGIYTCYINNPVLVANLSGSYVCNIPNVAAWNVTNAEEGIQFGIQSQGENVAGSISLNSVEIQLAPPAAQ